MANNEARLLSIIPQVSWYGGKAIPANVVGVPGVAKTQFVQQMAGKLEEILRSKKMLEAHEKLEIATYVLPQTSPDVLEGIAVPSTDRSVLNRLPLADLARLAKSKFGIMFGDELSSANPETGAAFMTFASDGRAGDLKLHEGIARIFAMNPAECAAAGRELSAPEANRFCWIKWKLPLADYTDYLRGGPGLLQHVEILPATWEEDNAPKTKLLIASFLENKRELVNELDNGAHAEMQTSASNKVNPHGPWASQRSWENGARLMAACMSLGETMRSELCVLALGGCVGDNASSAFFRWLADANMPDPEEMLANPKKAISMLPKRADHIKACLEQLVLAAKDKSMAERKKIDPLARFYIAGEIVTKVFEKNRDNAYSSMVMLSHSPPRALEKSEMASMQWLTTFFEFRRELGIGA